MKQTLALLFSFTFFISTSQNDKFCDELIKVNDIIQSSHFSPKPLNDSLSKHVFYLFLDKIDEDKHFFTENDISNFKKDEFLIDDHIKDKNCLFLTKYNTTLKSRIQDSRDVLESLRDINFDYSGIDSLHYYSKKDYSYFKNEKAQRKFWNKKVRYKILRKLVENDSIYSNISSNFKSLESSIKQKVIDNEICLLNDLEQTKGSLDNYVEEAFLDALLKYQDPNSAYLSSSDKNMFEQSVGNSQLSFGITTTKESNGDITIAHISAGSSAFKNGNFEVNDIIISLDSGNEIIETYCTSNETILNFLNNSENKSVSFKIKKKNGEIKNIKLTKNVVNIEANTITGFIIKDEFHNIGYINIPSFYTDLESINGLGVTNDVAKQIYKLQKQNIEALILDLRFNGGGSMKEAADLSGMFIDRGPVAISAIRNENNYTIRDPNRGTIFSKPIVILVNQFSASASEFFAGAMQDYNRAIIVGSITHGKATSQTIMPLNNSENTAFVKLTMGQFYRVTGKSHQGIGIKPDISLPNIYDGYKTREENLAYTLPNSTVDVIMKPKVKAKKNIDGIKLQSEERVNKSIAFKAIKDFNAVFINNYVYREGSYPLSLDFIFNDDQNYFEAYSNYEKAMDNTKVVYEVRNTDSTNEILTYNSEDKELNKNLKESIAKYPYIQEAYYIANSILNQ